MGRGGHRRYRHLKILKGEAGEVEGWKGLNPFTFCLQAFSLTEYLNILEKVLE
jgi:hypothetical protein